MASQSSMLDPLKSLTGMFGPEERIEIEVELPEPLEELIIRKTVSQDALSVLTAKSWKSNKSNKSTKSNKSNKSGSSYKSLPGRLSGSVRSVFRRSNSSKSISALSDPGAEKGPPPQTPPKKLVTKKIKMPPTPTKKVPYSMSKADINVSRDSQAPSLEASSDSHDETLEDGSTVTHDDDDDVSILSEEYDHQSMYGRSVHSSFDKSVDRIIDALDKVIPRSFTGDLKESEEQPSQEEEEEDAIVISEAVAKEEGRPATSRSSSRSSRRPRSLSRRSRSSSKASRNSSKGSKRSRSSSKTPMKQRKERLSTKSPGLSSAVSDPMSTHSNTTDVVSNVMSDERSKRSGRRGSSIFRRGKSIDASREDRKRSKKKKVRSRSVSSSRSERERRRTSFWRRSERAERHDDRSVATYSTTETFENGGIIRTFLDFVDSIVDEYDDRHFLETSFSFGSDGSGSLHAGYSPSPSRRKKLNTHGESSSQASTKSSIWERLASAKPNPGKDSGLFPSVSDCVSTGSVCDNILNPPKGKKTAKQPDSGSDAFGLESLIKIVQESTGYSQDQTKEVLERYRTKFPDLYSRLGGDSLCGSAVVEPQSSEREGPGTRCSAPYSAPEPAWAGDDSTPEPAWPGDEEAATPLCKNRKTLEVPYEEPKEALEDQSKSSPDVVWSPDVFDESFFDSKSPEIVPNVLPNIRLDKKDEVVDTFDFPTNEFIDTSAAPLGKFHSEPQLANSLKRVSRSNRSFRNRSRNRSTKTEDAFSLIPEEEPMLHTDASQWEPFAATALGGVDWSPSKLKTPQKSNAARQTRQLDWELEKYDTSTVGDTGSQLSSNLYGESDLEFEFFETQDFGADATPF